MVAAAVTLSGEGNAKGFEMSLIVVVGPFLFFPLGVTGAKPMLSRAFAGAGRPGRRTWPGSGVDSSVLLKSNFLSIVGVGSKLK